MNIFLVFWSSLFLQFYAVLGDGNDADTASFTLVNTVGSNGFLGTKELPRNDVVFMTTKDDLNVACKSSVNDNSIRWIREGPPDTVVQSSILQGGSFLVLPNQSAKYTCFSADHKERKNVTITIYLANPRVTVKKGDVDMLKAGNESSVANITIDCYLDNNVNSTRKVIWYYNGNQLLEKEKEVEILSNGTLFIRRATEMNSGIYMCGIPDGGQTFYNWVNIPSPAYVHQKHQINKNQMEGDTVTLHCEIHGYPTPSIVWLRNKGNFSENVTANGRVELKPYLGIENATLTIRELKFDDRAEYTCVATNIYGSSNATTLVRVKDKLAALWPFLGIVAEVAILVTIIFLYEKRRAKREQEAEAEDSGEQKKALTEPENSEVRQRSVKA